MVVALELSMFSEDLTSRVRRWHLQTSDFKKSDGFYDCKSLMGFTIVKVLQSLKTYWLIIYLLL